jgi:hypothetical protein
MPAFFMDFQPVGLILVPFGSEPYVSRFQGWISGSCQ